MFIQWQLVTTKGKAPPRAYFQSVCEFIHEGNRYIAVYGVMEGVVISIAFTCNIYTDLISGLLTGLSCLTQIKAQTYQVRRWTTIKALFTYIVKIYYIFTIYMIIHGQS